MSSRTVVIRVDAAAKTGTGHVMRMIALAEALRGLRVKTVFVSARLLSGVAAILKQRRFEIVRLSPLADLGRDADGLLRLMGRLRCRFAVLDGYHFDAAYQRRLREGGARVLCVDDHRFDQAFDADMLLNPNPGAETSRYRLAARGTERLLGERYALIRTEFTRVRTKKKIYSPGRSRTAAVSLGGGNSGARLARRTRHYLEKMEPAIKVLAPQGKKFESLAPLFLQADFVATNGGTTVLEALCAGVPVCCVVVVDNQRPLARFLSKRGAAVCWDPSLAGEAALRAHLARLASDASLRRRLVRAGRRLVDGRGALRTAARIVRYL